MEMYNPMHPGEILKKTYLPEYKLTVTAFALKIGISRTAASELVNCKSGITAQTALKLAKAFKTTPVLWMNLQQQYDLWQAKQITNLDNVEVIAL